MSKLESCSFDATNRFTTNTLKIKRIVHLFWIVYVHLHIDITYTYIYMDMEMHGKENHILKMLNYKCFNFIDDGVLYIYMLLT